MPIEVDVWRIDGDLRKVRFSSLDEEARLENLIEKDVTLIEPGLMIIGRQVPTSYGKFVDLLAIDTEGNLVIVELKRNRTPRDVVAQTLDYASWVRGLSHDDIVELYSRKDPTRHLEQAFTEHFGNDIPEELNEAHRMVIVASALDPSTERIVSYLSSFGIPINVVFFRYFIDEGHEYISRTWLVDPTEVEIGDKNKEPWNRKDFYVSFGEGPTRSWEDARKYGFVSAGQGKWYSNTLQLLDPGKRVFVCIPKTGYVGVGVVKEKAARVDNFKVDVAGQMMGILEAPHIGAMDTNVGDPDRCEYLVRVDWIKTLAPKDAIWEKGFFANQNSACKLRNKFTIERLTARFGLDD